eukprot:7613356-Lingulodinium_polyedra.AAC.1
MGTACHGCAQVFEGKKRRPQLWRCNRCHMALCTACHRAAEARGPQPCGRRDDVALQAAEARLARARAAPSRANQAAIEDAPSSQAVQHYIGAADELAQLQQFLDCLTRRGPTLGTIARVRADLLARVADLYIQAIEAAHGALSGTDPQACRGAI